jgi:pyrimidine oxygenase
MKFGVFLPNGSNGYVPSLAAPRYAPSYRHNLAIAQEAEAQGLDFLLSMMKFRGFGGESGYWDGCLDSFTLMAGLAAATTRIGLFPSAALLATHPAVAARAVATIDDISGGRCGLNVVTGWNRGEYVQMGLWPGDAYYGRRYDYAAEYLAVLKALWTEGRVTHRGEFFTLDDCSLSPRPRDIPIVCAGQSPTGQRFTAQHGDYSFVMGSTDRLASFREQLDETAAGLSRKVGAYGLFTLVMAETDAEARRIGEDIIAQADPVAVAGIAASASLDSSAEGTSAHLRNGLSLPMEEGNIAFMGMPVIHGSPATIAAKIDDIAAATGLEGMLFAWLDYVPGIRRFGEDVIPRLRCR